MPRPIVTFLSDFGHSDWFVGVVHGVLHSRAPEAHVVDLSHSIPPAHVARAAFMLEAAAHDFPPGTVHLAVVDPGVGTDRRALAVESHGQFFVGPDNGLLEWAFCSPEARVHVLTETRFFRTPVSRTFHGRDVFAPVAAALACGEPIASFGPRVHDPVRLPAHEPSRRGETLVGQVVFVDRFGNALTNLTGSALAAAFGETAPDTAYEVAVLERVIPGISRSYGDAPVGTLVALLGSSGRLEIAQVGGAATDRLGLGEGDAVVVRRRT
ncbi:MAG: S-adenosyl-l-methionine hydroxide adenosyltransferase family protein [bacterium]